MRVPHIKPVPKGGLRQYGGVPVLGTWNKWDKRYHITHKGKTYKVARLVAEAFHGPPLFERAVVMHLDENSRNNKPSNLAWGTQKENLNAPGHIAYRRSRTGENSSTAIGRRRKVERQMQTQNAE